MPYILTISERTEDRDFGTALANAMELPAKAVADVAQLKTALEGGRDALVLWDVDHDKAGSGQSSNSVQAIAQALRGSVPPHHVFAISSRPLSELPQLLNLESFRQHIFRSFADPAAEVMAQVGRACFSTAPMSINQYLPPGTVMTQLEMTNAGLRGKFVEVLHQNLSRVKIPDQLAALVAQSADELLMNAIFDAPIKDGKAYYKDRPRDQKFALKTSEAVTFEIGSTKNYTVICVSDQFGTLRPDTILGALRQNYEKTMYKPQDRHDPGAGLGIYNMIQSGVSLMYVVQPKTKTQAYLFVPHTTTFRKFRETFRFVVVLGD